jgi:hypothetical protein
MTSVIGIASFITYIYITLTRSRSVAKETVALLKRQ